MDKSWHPWWDHKGKGDCCLRAHLNITRLLVTAALILVRKSHGQPCWRSHSRMLRLPCLIECQVGSSHGLTHQRAEQEASKLSPAHPCNSPSQGVYKLSHQAKTEHLTCSNFQGGKEVSRRLKSKKVLPAVCYNALLLITGHSQQLEAHM